MNACPRCRYVLFDMPQAETSLYPDSAPENNVMDEDYESGSEVYDDGLAQDLVHPEDDLRFPLPTDESIRWRISANRRQGAIADYELYLQLQLLPPLIPLVSLPELEYWDDQWSEKVLDEAADRLLFKYIEARGGFQEDGMSETYPGVSNMAMYEDLQNRGLNWVLDLGMDAP